MEYLISLTVHLILVLILVFVGGPSGSRLTPSDDLKAISVTLMSSRELRGRGIKKVDPKKLPPPKWTPPKEKAAQEELVFFDEETLPKKKERKPILEKGDVDPDKAKRLQDAIAQIKKEVASRPKPRDDNYGFGKEAGDGVGIPGGGGEEIPSYMRAIRERIKSNFFVRKNPEKLEARIHVWLSPDRSIRKLEIEQESGNHLYDLRCEHAIKKTAPFSEAPDDELRKLMLGGFVVGCNY